MKLIKTIITIILLVLCIVNTASASYMGNVPFDECYPETALITELDYDLDMVTCVTFTGTVYHFKGIYDWAEYDLVSMFVWDAETILDKSDDVILMTEVGGWLTDEEAKSWLQSERH